MAKYRYKVWWSSLADASQLKNVKQIIESNPERRYVVASAPGRGLMRTLKLRICSITFTRQSFRRTIRGDLGGYQKRFVEMKNEAYRWILKNTSMRSNSTFLNGASRDYVASRGEYLNSILIADYLGFELVDAAEIVCFDSQGFHDNASTMHKVRNASRVWRKPSYQGFTAVCRTALKNVFQRRFDISGAIIAGALNADLYENWTDGLVFNGRPRIVKGAHKIDMITYRELESSVIWGPLCSTKMRFSRYFRRQSPITCVIPTTRENLAR